MSENRVEEIKARRQMADCALGNVHWEWSHGMLDNGRQAFFGLYAYNADKSARVEIMSPSQGHIDIDPTEAHFIEHAPADIDYLLSELARLQTECAALRAANADLHLIVDRTPEGDRHGKIAR